MSVVERLYAFTPGLRCCAIITREYVGRRGAVRQFETCGNPATEAVEIQLDRRTGVRHYCADHFAALAAVLVGGEMTDDEHREQRYRAVDACVTVFVVCVFALIVSLAGCASPTEPDAPPRPPRPPRPAVCWGNTPGCVSL